MYKCVVWKNLLTFLRKVQYIVSNRLQISTEPKLIFQNTVFIVMAERFYNLTIYGWDSHNLERFTKVEEKY
jgi:hypothetical protein